MQSLLRTGGPESQNNKSDLRNLITVGGRMAEITLIHVHVIAKSIELQFK